MSELTEREVAIFNAARRLTGSERRAYLDQACADDAALRQRLDELLGVDDPVGDFLEKPACADTGGATISGGTIPSLATLSEKPGDRIGRYKLLQHIGEGGCGLVYMAEQEEPVRRRVALKVIKLGMDTRSVIARFEADRQALALMDHPNIAKVLDAGAVGASDSPLSTPNSQLRLGRPYFVMELVKGVPITEFCDKNRLPARERIKLFIIVCQAIQSAHQKGIIHRDIKPTNVLVTLNAGVPMPMVIDFGVAKATHQKLTEKTVFTNFGAMIGTPAYMSPEQAEMSHLDVDTRSDIYGLGVLLYELLTGTTPFPEKRLRSAGYREMQRIILEEEPERPSTRLSTLKGEQRSIVARNRGAAELAVGGAFADDLDWIVMKCLEKDRSRRYETANGLAADLQRHLKDEPVVARPPSRAYRLLKAWQRNKLEFTAGVTVVAALVVGIGISTWQAVVATRAKTLAKERLAESEAISKFLTGVFRSPDPARDGRTITVAETLSNAVQKLNIELTNQPARLANLEATIGSTYYALGLFHEAISLQETVRDYHLATSGPDHTNTLYAMSRLARSYSAVDRTEEAIKLQEAVLPLIRKARGPEDPNTLMALNNLAAFYREAGRRDEALRLQEEVLALRRKVNGPEDPDTLMAMHNLALSYHEAGRRDEALKMREQLLPLYRKAFGPEHAETLPAMYGLADSYEQAGRPDEALKLREQLLALSRKILGPEHRDTINAIQPLADSYDEAGRWDEALKLREQEVALYRKVIGPEHSDTLGAIPPLANSYLKTGRREEGIKLLEQALPLLRKLHGLEHPDTLSAMNALTDSYFSAGRISDVIALLEQSCAADPKNTLASLRLATWQTWLGRADDYEATRRRLVQQAEGTDQAERAERATKVYCLRPSTDPTLLARALNLARQGVELGKKSSWLPWFQLGLGFAEYRNGQFAAAEQTLTIAEQTAGGDGKHELQGTARLFRTMSLFQQDKPEEARKLFSQAEAQMPPLPKDESKPLVDGKPASHDLLICWMAYKEAKALLEGSPAPVPEPLTLK